MNVAKDVPDFDGMPEVDYRDVEAIIKALWTNASQEYTEGMATTPLDKRNHGKRFWKAIQAAGTVRHLNRAAYRYVDRGRSPEALAYTLERAVCGTERDWTGTMHGFRAKRTDRILRKCHEDKDQQDLYAASGRDMPNGTKGKLTALSKAEYQQWRETRETTGALPPTNRMLDQEQRYYALTGSGGAAFPWGQVGLMSQEWLLDNFVMVPSFLNPNYKELLLRPPAIEGGERYIPKGTRVYVAASIKNSLQPATYLHEGIRSTRTQPPRKASELHTSGNVAL
jgi:hypothetical protein